MSFTIDYKLTSSGSGWAECTISDGEQSCTITASYLGDALGDLVLAANAMLHWYNGVSFSFQEEPGEYRWEFRWLQSNNDFELKISEAYRDYEKDGHLEYHVVFQTVVTPKSFGKAVHETATKLLAEYGEQGYLEKWVLYPFPSEGMSELTRLLAEVPGS